MDVLDWLQIAGSAALGVVGGMESDTSGLDWLEASAGAVGLVISGFALLAAAMTARRRI